MTDDDEIGALLAQVSMGDRRAFRQLYDATAPRLFGLCFGIVKERGAAEDVLCEVFDRIWNRAGQMHPNGTTGQVWLITLTRDAAVDRLRDMRAAGEADPPLEIAERLYHNTQRKKTGDSAEEAALQLCLTELPEDRVRVLRAAYLQGATYHDQAEAAGESEDKLRSLVRGSLMQLRACLSQ